MMNCQTCRDRLFDHVYGLLEESDQEATLLHLKTCSACQSALADVQTQQKLLARAAKAIPQVPEFSPACDEEPAPTVLETTIPLPPPEESAPPRWRSPWIIWSAAAALLIAISLPVSYYRIAVRTHQDTIAQKRRDHKEIADKFAMLPAQYGKLHDAAVAEVHHAATPYVHVLGPKTIQPGAKARLHITAHHPEGTVAQTKNDAARAQVRVKVYYPLANNQTEMRVVHLKCDDNGHATAELDANGTQPNSVVKVIVEAEAGTGRSRVEETINIAAPTYVTRIDTSKVAYQLRDMLFFRALVVDRYSLMPPRDPIALRVELRTPAGQIAKAFNASTGDGGMMAGEIVIDEKYAVGGYTLHVRPAEDKAPVQSSSQQFVIAKDLRAPDLVLDPGNYLPGQVVGGFFQSPATKPPMATINDIPIPLMVQRQQMLAPMAAPGFGGAGGAPFAKKDNGKSKNATFPAAVVDQVFRFEAKLPEVLPPGASSVPLTLKFTDGKTKSEIRGFVPIAPTEFAIDFFPEGGDLIAGLPNRVFYRVRAKSGEAITSSGRVWILASDKRIPKADSAYEHGMGYLDFVPDAKETYTVQISTPVKIESIADPFAKLGIRSSGVVIQITDLDEEKTPKAVGHAGDPIRIRLHQHGPARKVLLVAQCRGQIVDQRWVDARRDPVDVALLPTQEAVGIIRVTAYQTRGEALVPIAERLVYRAGPRLNLGVTLNPQQVNAGRPFNAKVTARDALGQLVPHAWVLASVVDERWQKARRSLSAHFMLLNEIRTGADLDQTQILIDDSPEAANVLERFLGTHGWRRFIPGDETNSGNVNLAVQPAVFSMENGNIAAIQKKYDDLREGAVSPIRGQGFAQRIELESERDRAADAVVVAVGHLNDLEDRVQTWIRLALGVLLAVLLLTALVLMGIGTYRVIRAEKPATLAFGASFGCLACSLALIFFGSMLAPISLTPLPSLAANHGKPGFAIKGELDERFANLPALAFLQDKTVTGMFALPRDKAGEAESTMRASADKGDAPAITANAGRGALRRDMADAQAMERGKKDEQQNLLGTPQFNRFAAKNKADVAITPAVPTPPAGGGPETKADAKKTAREQADAWQYAHQHAPELCADTLLWRPTLVLQNGSVDLHFDIAAGDATYRVLILAHTRNGQFGFFETRLDVLGR